MHYEAHLIISNMRAVRRVSAGDGMDWAVIVKFKDSRGGDKEARIFVRRRCHRAFEVHSRARLRGFADPCRGPKSFFGSFSNPWFTPMFCLLIVSPRRAGSQSARLTFSRCRLAALSRASRKK